MAFDYEKYFDIPKGKDHPRFEGNNHTNFDPDYTSHGPYIVNEIKELADKSIMVSFSFRSTVCEWREQRQTLMKATFTGSIICDGIVSLKKEQIDDDGIIFTIDKGPWSGWKIIQIQSAKVGKVTIKSRKLYAENLDYHIGYDDEEQASRTEGRPFVIESSKTPDEIPGHS